MGGVLRATWGPVAGGAGAAADAKYSLAVVGGGRVAVGHESGAIRVRDTARGAVASTLAGHTDRVRALAALPGGRLASASKDHSVRVWARRAGYSDAPRNPAGGPSVVRIWNLKRRALDAVISGHTHWVCSLTVLRDGRLASGSRDRAVKVWDERALGVRGGACAAAHGWQRSSPAARMPKDCGRVCV